MANLEQSIVESWILTQATGKFHYTKVMDGQVSPDLYPQLRVVMKRLFEKNVCFPVDGRDGWWRPADVSLEEVMWWNSAGLSGDNLLLPFGLHKYCYIPIPSLVIYAGKYNAGKTALCINTVNQNLERWENNIHFFVSEGAELMGQKFKALNSFIPSPPPFKVWRKMENFADVIRPDGLNIIDYLRVDMQQTYAVANDLFQIFSKLRKGIAVVAMQKPPGMRRLAFGGAATAFEPTLYLSIDKGYIGFEKVKFPKPEYLSMDFNTLKVEFELSKGVNFNNIVEIQGGFDA